jgi:DNA-binding transcriptional LysR family regulator
MSSFGSPNPTPTLEQLRVLTVVADEGSFSGAARRLGRSQPVVSYMMTTLESELGFAVFERGKRKPVLTERGVAVLAHARRMCLMSDQLVASAENLRRGLENELTIAVDLFFPPERLAQLLREMGALHPSIDVLVRSTPLGGVLDLVMQRECALGVCVLTMDWPDGIEARDFGAIEFLPVAAPGHPLAAFQEPPPVALVREHTQLILRDPGSLTRHLDLAIAGVRTWRLTDLAMKLAMLREGLGWGHMPLHLVRDDLARGTLVKLQLAVRSGGTMPYTLIHRVDSPPGPAGRWLAERLVAWDRITEESAAASL